MAYQTSRDVVNQIDPLLAQGYPYENRYHNVGQLQTPYKGKRFGVGGDYGPPQNTVYYTERNRNYPYPLDKDQRPVGYVPSGQRSCDCNNPFGYHSCVKSLYYPGTYRPEDYFRSTGASTTGHSSPSQKFGRQFHPGNNAVSPTTREGYKSLQVAPRALVGGKNFYPFSK